MDIGNIMATDINEVYKMFPCAEQRMKDNHHYWAESSNKDESYFEVWLDTLSMEDELYDFLEDLESYDILLLKRNEITPEEERNNRDACNIISEKYLRDYKDMDMWRRISGMDWGEFEDDLKKETVKEIL